MSASPHARFVGGPKQLGFILSFLLLCGFFGQERGYFSTLVGHPVRGRSSFALEDSTSERVQHLLIEFPYLGIIAPVALLALVVVCQVLAELFAASFFALVCLVTIHVGKVDLRNILLLVTLHRFRGGYEVYFMPKERLGVGTLPLRPCLQSLLTDRVETRAQPSFSFIFSWNEKLLPPHKVLELLGTLAEGLSLRLGDS